MKRNGAKRKRRSRNRERRTERPCAARNGRRAEEARADGKGDRSREAPCGAESRSDLFHFEVLRRCPSSSTALCGWRRDFSRSTSGIVETAPPPRSLGAYLRPFAPPRRSFLFQLRSTPPPRHGPIIPRLFLHGIHGSAELPRNPRFVSGIPGTAWINYIPVETGIRPRQPTNYGKFLHPRPLAGR